MSKRLEYTPVGVCARKIIIEVDDNNIIRDVKIDGGCPGNSLGVSKLVINKDVNEVIDTLSGIRCGLKNTSCPDQLSKALKKITEEL